MPRLFVARLVVVGLGVISDDRPVFAGTWVAWVSGRSRDVVIVVDDDNGPRGLVLRGRGQTGNIGEDIAAVAEAGIEDASKVVAHHQEVLLLPSIAEVFVAGGVWEARVVDEDCICGVGGYAHHDDLVPIFIYDNVDPPIEAFPDIGDDLAVAERAAGVEGGIDATVRKVADESDVLLGDVFACVGVPRADLGLCIWPLQKMGS